MSHLKETLNKEEKGIEVPYKLEIVWTNVIYYIILHLVALYGFFLIFSSAKIATFLWAYLLYEMTGIGVTAAVHRLWSHRSYKVNRGLVLVLTILNTMAMQNSVIIWARDHRLHHKFSETDADPHNANRGIFFSHVGWLMCKKHPEVKRKGKLIDISDLTSDPILAFQHKHYMFLAITACHVIPTLIPMYLWNESFINAFCVNIFRYVVVLNVTWLVNSAAHFYGSKPYDRTMQPSENIAVSILTGGEGWHNFHHSFPWDYRASELGNFRFNQTLFFIHWWAKMGWAYDLKSVSDETIKNRVLRSGDGSHSVWGWRDKNGIDTRIDEIRPSTIDSN